MNQGKGSSQETMVYFWIGMEIRVSIWHCAVAFAFDISSHHIFFPDHGVHEKDMDRLWWLEKKRLILQRKAYSATKSFKSIMNPNCMFSLLNWALRKDPALLNRSHTPAKAFQTIWSRPSPCFFKLRPLIYWEALDILRSSPSQICESHLSPSWLLQENHEQLMSFQTHASARGI